MSKTTNKICPKLVNGRRCDDTFCRSTRDHKPWSVKRWITSQKPKPCRHVWPCWDFERDICLYFHAPDEKKFEDQRRELMLKHLDAPVKVDIPVTSNESGGGGTPLRNVMELSSFNRITANEIIIPGEPSFFSPPKTTLEFQKNSPENGAKLYPQHRHVYEPLLKSIKSMRPDFDFTGVDLVVNVGSLRRILHYLSDPASAYQAQRFDLEWQGGTLFITRWAADPQRNISAGFGTSFERATCTFAPGFEDSASHHRVLSYQLGGLKCVVQAEVDSYSCNCHPLPIPSRSEADLDIIFERLNVGAVGETKEEKLPSSTTETSGSLKVREGGRNIPSSCLMELKTRNQFNPPHFEADMYFARQSRIYEGLHVRGIFRSIEEEIEDKSDHLTEWERKNQRDLESLIKFLKALVLITRGHANDNGMRQTALIIGMHGRENRASLYDRTGGRSLVPESFGK